MKKKTIVVLLLLGAAAAFGLYQCKGGAKTDAPALRQTIAAVSRGDIEQLITSQGTLEAKEYVDVGSQVTGQLKTLNVAIGDSVKKGALIAEIDPKIYESRAQSAEAQLKQLRAQLAEQKAQTELAAQIADRNKRLFDVKAVSKELLQTTATDLKVAKARITSLEAQIEASESGLNETRTNLGFTRIFAPIDGTVVTQTSRQGQTLVASQAAPVIVQLANLDTMTVRAQVAEADVLNVKPGMDVYFTILGSQTRRWNGKVRQVLPSPKTTNAVVLYDVLVDVDNSDHQLMTGMTTQMFFVMGSAKNVLQIPVTALIKPVPEQDGEKGKAYLVRVQNGAAKTDRTVFIGLQNREKAEVTEGLSESDKLIVETAPPTDTASRPRRPPGFF